MKSISEEKRRALEKLGMHPELMLCPATGRMLTVISSVHEYVKDGKTMNLLHISVSLKNRNPNCRVLNTSMSTSIVCTFGPPRISLSCGAGWERKTTGEQNESLRLFPPSV